MIKYQEYFTRILTIGFRITT